MSEPPDDYDDFPIELKRVSGLCCPTPTCDYVRDDYIKCEDCGSDCKKCKFNPKKEEK